MVSVSVCECECVRRLPRAGSGPWQVRKMLPDKASQTQARTAVHVSQAEPWGVTRGRRCDAGWMTRTHAAEPNADRLVNEEHAIAPVPGARIFQQRKVGLHHVWTIDVQHAEEAAAAGAALQVEESSKHGGWGGVGSLGGAGEQGHWQHHACSPGAKE